MLLLKLDYDNRRIVKRFHQGVFRIFIVYHIKRDHYPKMNVVAAFKTRKGWHILIEYEDYEKVDNVALERCKVIVLQNTLGSDVTRSLFDLMRALSGEQIFNLMFSYKNKRFVQRDRKMEDKLNLCIRRIEKKFGA